MNLAEIVTRMEITLHHIGYDLKQTVDDLGQIERFEKRSRGDTFDINEHVKGMILALLSNQRPWKPIMQNMTKITEIFLNFQVEKLKQADKRLLAEQLKGIKCGNRAIDKQLASLDFNLSVFEQIELDYGSLDKYVISDSPIDIAWELAKGKKYKLKQIGFALALEYLRNVGIQAIKPDLHLRRIISKNRLNLYPGYPSEIDTYRILSTISKEANVSLTYIDNLMWVFCATDYANVCGSNPKCHICQLQDNCNMAT
ncbi:hypothetical protein [Paenibacillus sp. GYB003]|uniref:hypothetical protein n=1 Tax=Paenibacillus sp. GYB003 TaxID=2994392 RepID=UPI002F96533B